ncbi:ion transporter [Labilibaculum manganireducens]|uniref:Ion transporter n=1 Tax=Labilibaculum manganireducens TaxID=1940525 RepID=A0A2N3I7I0_9BACT|nr:ion transporter [Labilibaculum manganireducens]PKQ66258.1 ion transporter [Labilibaculum manganireducens]
MSITKDRLYEIIFEADTKPGKIFDISLLIVIILSILLVVLESVPSIERDYHDVLKLSEWLITAIFSLEYMLRIWIVQKPKAYIFSFYGIIDLLSVLPSYLGLVVAGTHGFMVIRALRLLRIFRILKLNRYIKEGAIIVRALRQSRIKISVFLFAVLTMVIIIGTIMYLIEGSENGFTSIPRGIYWAVVTLTTVGYGDISPATSLGQFFASFVMIIGYAIIAVPTGIVTVELSKQSSKAASTQVCPNCLADNHTEDALYCNQCGKKLNQTQFLQKK